MYTEPDETNQKPTTKPDEPNPNANTKSQELLHPSALSLSQNNNQDFRLDKSN